jgi:tetratricopeptide (TPR) repeat protein
LPRLPLDETDCEFLHREALHGLVRRCIRFEGDVEWETARDRGRGKVVATIKRWAAMDAFAAGNFEEAQSLLSGARELNPDDRLVCQFLGAVNLELGEYQEAQNWFSEQLRRADFWAYPALIGLCLGNIYADGTVGAARTVRTCGTTQFARRWQECYYNEVLCRVWAV